MKITYTFHVSSNMSQTYLYGKVIILLLYFTSVGDREKRNRLIINLKWKCPILKPYLSKSIFGSILFQAYLVATNN